MIKKGIEIALNVRPIYIGLVHQYVFEGPCRFGKGEELTPEYDMMANAQFNKDFQEECKKHLEGQRGINLMEPIYVERHCDLLTKEAFFEEMTKDLEQVDLFLVGLEIARGDLVVELAQRTKKPVMIVPENCCMIGDCVPAMRVRCLEAYGHYCWEDAAKQMQALRLRKVMAHTNVLQVVRFNSNNAIASDATFYSENEVTRLLGTKFRGINLHELIDQFVPGDPMANHCTPGRMGVNPTAEDMKEIERITDELLAGACEVGMEKDKLMVSVRMWYTVMKMLELYDCNAFVAPCPDSCATRRMNEEQFTFCLTHSLNNEIGIPSACEYDVGALLSMQVLNSVSGCAAYMGNTNPLMYENGVAQPRRSVSEEDLKDIKNEPNLCFTFHSTPNRKLHGYDKPNTEYGIQPFAYSGWGATLRHDFNKDKGQVITMCRFAPDCKKLFVAKGVIMGGTSFHEMNCNLTVIFQVKDSKDFFEKQINFGNHIPLTYGDYTEEIKLFAKSVGMEVVEA